MSSRGLRRILALALALAAAACGPGGDEAAPADAGSTVRTYRVRGVLQSLPDPQTGAGQLRIRHEAIPDLIGQSGEVEGMAEMTMPFPVSGDLDLSGFAVGDVVLFDLRVEWEAARPVVVTAMESLPAETEPTFE